MSDLKIKCNVTLAQTNDPNILAFVNFTISHGFFSVTVEGARLIQPRGEVKPFLAMPSEFKRVACPKCGRTNPSHNRHCGGCGALVNSVSVQPTRILVARSDNPETSGALLAAAVAEFYRQGGRLPVPG